MAQTAIPSPGDILKQKRRKPRQLTIVSRTLARSLIYLQNHGLADFSRCNLRCLTLPGSHKIVKRVRTYLDIQT